MANVLERVVAALVVACIACISTVKTVGIMQQCGYRNRAFGKWLHRKDNLLFNRLSVLALCLALSTAVTALCFSFLGVAWALLLSAIPFLSLFLWFWQADNKYALKVPTKRTARFMRLFGGYYFFTALFAYLCISLLSFLSALNGSKLYALLAYVPFAVLPIALPVCLRAANACTGVFEEARNRKFVKRGGQVLDETKIIRVAVVGSYGKTSVKNILKTLLSEKYSAVETPASYNTPVGIAMTVFSEAFPEKQVFIAEMGARKAGDIRELCQLVKPDFAVFTGICPQHVATFGNLDAVFAEKSEILRCGARVVCGEDLRERVTSSFGEKENVAFVGESNVENLRLSVQGTAFTLCLGGEKIEVETPLLGRAAAENIALSAALALQMGLTTREIAAGIAKLAPVPHRLERIENNGVYILDDGYNCNVRGAKNALEVLSTHAGRKCVVTPGIVEGGILEEELNGTLGEMLATCGADKVILVGDTLVGAVKAGYVAANGEEEKLVIAHTLDAAQVLLADWIEKGDCVLFLNDLPDVY